ncbi:MAG TPA: hypothetical protein VHM25_02790 [Polyangiaceae bacterium]|jgi:hypothetical protein|nr:hypothetical protein [Polyangiaceae bacterium]
MSSLPFCTRPSELVLWVELISVWTLGNYWLAPDTHRTNGGPALTARSAWRTAGSASLVATLAALLPAPATSAGPRVVLAALLGSLTLISVAGRNRLVRSARGRRWLTEWELSLLGTLVTGTAIVICESTFAAAPPSDWLRSGRAAALLTFLGAICFAFRGGTYIVRGVLDKVGAKPTVRRGPAAISDPSVEPRPLDLPELNRGRTIGHLERLLMVMVIGLGSYQALAFLIAAKGLIRAKEFEDRDFAEYFILGSLTSAAVALPLGVLVQVTLPILWALPP